MSDKLDTYRNWANVGKKNELRIPLGLTWLAREIFDMLKDGRYIVAITHHDDTVVVGEIHNVHGTRVTICEDSTGDRHVIAFDEIKVAEVP